MIRVITIGIGAMLLADCGGPGTSQSNNASANISNSERPAASASTSTISSLALTPVSGHEAKMIMHERHEGMKSIGKANKAIHDQLQSGSPDLAVIRASAGQIVNLSQKADGWFNAGTGRDAGKTGAKAEIWQSPQDFAAKLDAFQKSAQALQSAAGGDELTAIRTRLGELGRTCKACHSKYRTDMHHMGDHD
jgi:cytochrome c556